MQPIRERIPETADSSWRFYLRELDALPFEWHHHPEFELTLTLNSSGERYVGDHIAPYQHGDLVLLGPNLPHSWASNDGVSGQLHRVYVLWFSQPWVERLADSFPEFRAVAEMMTLARRGLVWPNQSGLVLKPQFERLAESGPALRTVRLMGLLLELANQPARQLASERFDTEPTQADDQSVLSSVLNRIHADYAEPLTLDTLAASAHVSVSTLNRLFRKQMGQSAHQYLTQVRLGNACGDLVNTSRPISLIAGRHGFANLANFNRLFRKYRSMSPREFRQRHGRRDLLPGQTALAGQLKRA